MFNKLFARLNFGHSEIQNIALSAGSGETSQVETKTFFEDLNKFNVLLSNGEPFSLVRFGDGEMKIIFGEKIDLSSKYNGEHRYIPGQRVDEQQRALLAESLHYQNDRYFVGIACPCCVGVKNFSHIKKISRQPEHQLTWANIFVNANYRIFLDKTTPLLSQRKIALICHAKANTDGLPFSVDYKFSTGANSWVRDHKRLSEELSVFFTEMNQSGDSSSWVVLFCAGVLSNLLVKEMTESFPDHTYIDVGSVYDDMLGLGKTRKYLKGGKNLRKTCVWQ